MPTATYTPLANITLSGTANLVTFSSINQSYRDLVLVIDGLVQDGSFGNDIVIRFNSDATGSNYESQGMIGNGNSPAADSLGSNKIGVLGDRQSNIILNIMEYSASDKRKNVLCRSNAPLSSYSLWRPRTEGRSVRWNNTAAITSIGIYSSVIFVAGTTMALYGIVA